MRQRLILMRTCNIPFRLWQRAANPIGPLKAFMNALESKNHGGEPTSQHSSINRLSDPQTIRRQMPQRNPTP